MAGFASGISDSLGNVMDMLSEVINAFLGTENSQYITVLIIVALITGSTFKELLKKIPIFEGDGGKTNASGNIVAWSSAVLSIVGIHWMAEGQRDRILETFAGPGAMFIIMGAGIWMGYIVFKSSASRRGAKAAFAFGATVLFIIAGLRGFGNLSTWFITYMILAIIFMFITKTTLGEFLERVFN